MRRLTVLAALLATSEPACAQGVFEDVDELDRRIAATLPDSSAYQAMKIDRRLRLERCTAPADIDPPRQGAIAVRCPSRGWKLRVGLQQSDKAELVVRRGDRLELTASGQGYSIRTWGTALEDGTVGQIIHVEGLVKGRRSAAKVLDAGRAMTEF